MRKIRSFEDLPGTGTFTSNIPVKPTRTVHGVPHLRTVLLLLAAPLD